MTEFEKLRHRLKHINRNVFEYRMTVAEAKNLVAEFDALTKQLEKPQIDEVVLNEPATTTRIIDGGAL